MKLNREALAHYLDTKFNKSVDDVEQAEFEVIGDDIEDMSVELNSDTEQMENILGQRKTTDNGYSPSMDADPFYADPEKKLYQPLRDIALERKKGDACKTLMLEVVVEDTEAEKHLAYLQEVMVKPTSYGGDTSGVNIPFTVSEDGERRKGYVTAESLKSKAPKFTEGAIEAVALRAGVKVAQTPTGAQETADAATAAAAKAVAKASKTE